MKPPHAGPLAAAADHPQLAAAWPPGNWSAPASQAGGWARRLLYLSAIGGPEGHPCRYSDAYNRSARGARWRNLNRQACRSLPVALPQ
jgi:hypothetical protein